MLIAEKAAEAGFHAPDCHQRSGRHPVAALDRGQQLGVGVLHLLAAGDDCRAAALFHELVEGELEAALAAIGADRVAVVGDIGEGLLDRLRMDAACNRLRLEVLHPVGKTGAVIAALGCSDRHGRGDEGCNKRGCTQNILHELFRFHWAVAR